MNKLNQLANETLRRIRDRTGDDRYGVEVFPTIAAGADGVDFNITHNGRIVQTFNIEKNFSGWQRVVQA